MGNDARQPVPELRSRALFRTISIFLRVMSPLVPSERRPEWQEEWESEAWHQIAEHEQSGLAPNAIAFDMARRVCGAFSHAISIRRNNWRPEMFAQDVAYAARIAVKRPIFTLLVVGMLALGIGANTAMFTVVNSVLLQPIQLPASEQLVAMNGSFSRNENAAISPLDFLDYQSQNRVMSSMSAYQNGNISVLTGRDKPERIPTWLVSANFFSTLNVKPALGRAFVAGEDSTGHDVAIISHRLWQRRFHSDERVVGTSAVIDGRRTEIVGVMPAVLDETFSAELWRPFQFDGANTTHRRFHMLRAVGRLADGQTVVSAQSAMDVIAKRLEATYPENATWKLRLQPYRESVVRDSRRGLILLLSAVGLVLLIACGNVASLLLARATARRGEIGIRTALGASRSRLIRQLLTESFFLATLGGLGGLAIAVGLVHFVRIVGAGYVPRLEEVAVNSSVLLFTFSLSLLTGLVFGLAPALHMARSSMVSSFASLARTMGTRREGRARDALVTAQVAMSLVLLIGAGLLLRSLRELQNVDPGFTPDHVFTAQVILPQQQYGSRELQLRAWNRLLETVQHDAGVVSVAATTMLPMAGGGDTYFWRADQPPTQSSDRRNGMVSLVSNKYFETMKIPVTRGRTFDDNDREGTPNRVLINQRLAKRLFVNEDPIGKSLVVDFGNPTSFEIIGVVGDVHAFGPAQVAPGTLYFSVNQTSGFGADFFNLVVRAKGDALSLTHEVERALAAIDRDLPLVNPRTMSEVVNGSMARQQLSARLIGVFALTALVLAVIGLYGVLSYVVAQQSRELGIRLALGAQPSRLFVMVLRRGTGIVAIGLAVGIGAAFGLTRFMDALLFQTTPSDPMVFALVTLTMMTTGFLACLIPARRATRADPIAALRAE